MGQAESVAEFLRNPPRTPLQRSCLIVKALPEHVPAAAAARAERVPGSLGDTMRTMRDHCRGASPISSSHACTHMYMHTTHTHALCRHMGVPSSVYHGTYTHMVHTHLCMQTESYVWPARPGVVSCEDHQWAWHGHRGGGERRRREAAAGQVGGGVRRGGWWGEAR